MVQNNDILKKFGERVKNLRIEKGINSQMKLSFMAKLDRTYIGGIERGERNPSLKNLQKIAEAFGVELSELFRFK